MELSKVRKESAVLVLQHLHEEGYHDIAHTLERESGLYFNIKHFEELVLEGKWDDAEIYLSGFTSLADNEHSIKIFFEMRKQKYIEALDIGNRYAALDILMKELQVFTQWNQEVFKEVTQLLTIQNIRYHKSLSAYEDAEYGRKKLLDEIREIIKQHPQLQGKLELPAINGRRLRQLINQSLNWQHKLCENPDPYPVMKTLFEDHVCNPIPSAPISLAQFPPTTTQNAGLSAEKVPNTDPNEIFKGNPCLASDKVTGPIPSKLTTSVIQTLEDDSTPISMDFHPVQHTKLLVGTHSGDIRLWDASTGERLCSINFKVRNIGACSTNFKVALERQLCISVKRIRWSPDGSLFGAAFSQHIVQLYSYHGNKGIRVHLEIDAHEGSVNDMAFSSLHHRLLIITCGDDKTLKVWDATSGKKCHSFEGHDAPVCSICPHVSEDVHYILSASVNGKIKAWLYDSKGPFVEFDAPGFGYTTLAYTADNKRLFTCGTGKDGCPHLVEWDESEGDIKREYEGLKKPCFCTIHFDSIGNSLLAAGDDHMVKLWDMDKLYLSATIDSIGQLPENPLIKFNKEGRLLAVAAKENRIKILPIDDSIWRKWSANAPGVPLQTPEKNEDKMILEDETADSVEESPDKSKNPFEICEPSQCQSLALPVRAKPNKIVRLTYTHSGKSILALGSNGTHLLWRWPSCSLNLDGKATTRVCPHLRQPKSGSKFMCNDLTSAEEEGGEAVSCISLSKNDSYLLSTSGGKINLFNMSTLKNVTTIMAPPPTATCVAFYHQDNNIIAIGMDDSSILIYQVRAFEIMSKLEGHAKRVTALAFSKTLNILISADANAQICVWNTDGWGKLRDRSLQIHGQNVAQVPYETQIMLHPDMINFLVLHNTHLAIYEATELRCVNEWVPKVPVAISQATFSSDGQSVYASFLDGALAIFDASNFQMHCRVHPSAYLSSTPSCGIYPIAIAANPEKPTQFAAGLSDGSVYVFEPREQGGNWNMLSVDDVNEAEKNTTTKSKHGGEKEKGTKGTMTCPGVNKCATITREFDV